MKLLFFDTETTGTPADFNAPAADLKNWPRLVQLAWVIYDDKQNLLSENSEVIKPSGFDIPREASKIHGITNKIAFETGADLDKTLRIFHGHLIEVDIIIAHNISFDEKIISSEFIRNHMEDIVPVKQKYCTMKNTVDFCKLTGPYGYKWPKLIELYSKLFDSDFNQHNALDDVRATAKCFWEMQRRGIINSSKLTGLSKNTENNTEKLERINDTIIDGKIKTELIKENGIKRSYSAWHINGELWFKYLFTNGLETSFIENSGPIDLNLDIVSTKEIEIEFEHNDGIKTVKSYKSYYDNGKLRVDFHLKYNSTHPKHPSLHGNQTLYFRDGSKNYTGKFENGEEIGLHNIYNENGDIISSGHLAWDDAIGSIMRVIYNEEWGFDGYAAECYDYDLR